MKVAIVSRLAHMECIGFLLELLKDCETTIIADNCTDKHNWIEYYRGLYNFNVHSNFDINANDYNKIIRLTSNDYCFSSDENTISIVHYKPNMYLNNTSKHFISLTPYITGDDISYMFPIYNPPIIKSNANIITLIGYYSNSQIDNDLISFIQNNMDYQFVFVIWGGDYSCCNLNYNSNIKLLGGVDTSTLIQLIYDTKYILSKRHINYDRFSGQLSLAMSFQKPMIIDTRTASAYNLPGITFNENYCEINKLSNISDEKYDTIIEEIKVFNETTLRKNSEIMHALLYEK